MTPSNGVVLLRLHGPMQSWGIHARGRNNAHRTTHTHPTKSGTIGLVANALGRDYADPIGDLAGLRFGVRVDLAGRLEVDYHTTGAGAFPLLPREAQLDTRWRARARTGRVTLCGDEYVAPADVRYDPLATSLTAIAGNAVVTWDWYLADASFLAALHGPMTLVEQIADALSRPRRPLYLGRRGYLPSHSILAGTSEGSSLLDAFVMAPRVARSRPGPLRAWIEPMQRADVDAGAAVPASDQPVSFDGPGVRGARLELAVTVEPPNLVEGPP